MKAINKYKLIVLVLISLCILSCTDDFLELTDPNSINTENFFKNEGQIREAVNGAYGQLQNIFDNQFIFNELITDNTTVQINPQNRGQVDRVEAIDLWTYEASHFNIDVMFKDIYNNLLNINTILKRIEGADIDENLKNQFKGEMLFLRAFHYYHLTQYFGDIFLILEPIEDIDSSFEITRTSSNEVYNQIILDLQDASEFLPRKSEYSSEDIGRAPKAAALTLLGKVFLTVGSSSDAIPPLRTVVEDLDYNLLSNYSDIFDPSNKNHSESIFEIQYQGGNNLGVGSEFAYTFAPINSDGVITGFPAVETLGWNMPTNSIINAYEDGDLRKDVSLQENYTDLEGQIQEVPYINKYMNEHSFPGVTDDNWPVIRYAEAILLLAEALNEVTPSSNEAIELVNQVRDRAGLGPLSGVSQANLKEAILKERRVELAFENHRWFDLKRFLSDQELVSFLNAHGQEELANPTIDRSGVPFNPNDYTIEAFELIFPIPESQLLLTDNITQNPGY